MSLNNRKKNYTLSRTFYVCAIIIFASLTILSLVMSIIDRFTDQRIVIMLMNAWCMIFTMDFVTKKFNRQDEHFFWHDWKIFAKQSKINPPLPNIQQQDIVTDNHSEQNDVDKADTINPIKKAS
jgi:hypothetical protein